MLYKILAGPKAGKVEDLKPGVHLDALKAAGLVEPLPNPVSNPVRNSKPQASWKLVRTTGSPDVPGTLHVHVHCESCGQWLAIFNPSDHFVFGHCGVREHVPVALLQKGRPEWQAAIKEKVAADHYAAQLAATEPTQWKPKHETR